MQIVCNRPSAEYYIKYVEAYSKVYTINKILNNILIFNVFTTCKKTYLTLKLQTTK